MGYWLTGSILMSLGFAFMTLINAKHLYLIARIGNPLLILGYIFFYLGIKQYLGKKTNKWIPVSIIIIFNFFYYYNMYFNNSISARSFFISGTIAIVSFMIVYELLLEKDRLTSGTRNFNALVFCVYGCFHMVSAFLTFMSPAADSYSSQGLLFITPFVISILISNLWTFGLISMVNQRLNIDNQLEKEKFQSIFNTNLSAQFITTLSDGCIVDINEGFYLLSGYYKEEVARAFIQEISIWNDLADREVFITELKNKGICENMEFTFQKKDKSQFAGMISSRIITINSEDHIISVICDITERKQFEEALIESEEKYRSILNASPDDITITDLDGRILMISPAAKEMFGYESDFDNFMGMKLLDFIIPEDVERAKFNIMQMYEGSKQRPNEYRGVRQDKSIFDIEVNSGFVYNANDIPIKMVFIIRDITERKLIDLKIQELVKQLEIERNTANLNSITDSLTGLANRRHLDEILKTEFFRLSCSKSKLSLIMLDIDYFKKFNDNYGHLAGDDCLKMIASTLKTIVGRSPDIIARYGGEEFIAILPETYENGAEILGERIRKAVEELAIPHFASEISKHVTVSVGIATVYPAELTSPEQALKLVDEALYCAKERGRNRCFVAPIR